MFLIWLGALCIVGGLLLLGDPAHLGRTAQRTGSLVRR